jgi:hypothetical protein
MLNQLQRGNEPALLRCHHSVFLRRPYVDGEMPSQWHHVFASVQSLANRSLAEIPAERFKVVIMDEFHHAAAASYRRWLDHLRPQLLLGLTATPDRADGLDNLHWFGGRIASELRLWSALDQVLLSPSTTSPWPMPPISPPWNGAAAATCHPSSAPSTPATTAAWI